MLSFNFFLDVFGLNCSQVANLLGIKRASVYEWANERRTVPIKHIETLGTYFSVSPYALEGELTKEKGLEIINSKHNFDLKTLDKTLS